MKGKLLVCQTRGSVITYLPGGHVEFGEGAAVALAREIEEELGLACRVDRFLGCAEHRFRQKRRMHTEVNLIFAMSLQGATPEKAPPSREGHLAFYWIPMADLTAGRLEPAPLQRALPLWCRRRGAAPWVSTIFFEAGERRRKGRQP